MKTSYLIALLLALAAVGWIVSGQLGENRLKAEAQKPPVELNESRQAPQVRVRVQKAEPHVTELILRGRTEADRTVEVRAEASGRIIKLAADRGDRVTAGGVIARLDDKGRSAALKEAKALLAQREIEFKAADRLSQKGFRAATQVAAAQAALEAAEAAVRQAEVAVENTTITAPFDGLVDNRMVELGDFVETGDPLMQIVDLDPIVVVGQVNEQDIGRVRVGTKGQVRLISGQELSGEIAFVAAMADRQTRTFRVELNVANPNGALPDGVSAELRLPFGESFAHRLSPAALTLSEEGLLGIKVVTADNRVRFLAAEIVDYQPDGVWLTGLPEVITLITVGQEFVADGQEVRPVEEGSVVPADRAAS